MALLFFVTVAVGLLIGWMIADYCPDNPYAFGEIILLLVVALIALQVFAG